MDNKKLDNKQLIDIVKSMIEVEETPMTFLEAVQFMKVKSSTLYKLTHKKLIPYSKPGGKVLYFKKADLINWMNSNPVKTADQIDEEASNYLMSK
jgi:excisionase family DNA binding protein